MPTTHYTKSHEYIRVEGETGIIGITDLRKPSWAMSFLSSFHP